MRQRGTPLSDGRCPPPQHDARDPTDPDPLRQTMNTPDSQNIQPTQETPNAPLANRVRAVEHGNARQVRRRLDFDAEGIQVVEDPTPTTYETHWRLKAIEVKIVHGFPVHNEHTLTVELYDHQNPSNTRFNEPLDNGRLSCGTHTHKQLKEIGHVSMNVNCDYAREDFENEEEYRKHVNETFRSITYIKI